MFLLPEGKVQCCVQLAAMIHASEFVRSEVVKLYACRMKVVPVSRKGCGFEKAQFGKGIGTGGWYLCLIVSK
jgi:hypothetical protein